LTTFWTVQLQGTNTYSGGTTNNGLLIGTTASLQGDFLNNGNLVFSQTQNGTFSGNIEGTGAFFKQGTGIVTLDSANTFSGDTRIDGGQLVLNHSQSLENSTLDFNNYGGTLRFATPLEFTLGGLKGSQNLALTNENSQPVALTVGNNNSNQTYSGTLSGSGSLTKVGTGTLTLSNAAHGYSGDTTINAGRLIVNGSIASPVTLNAGGTLGGSGTVYGNVQGAGRVAPGNSPGILTINGNYTQTSASVLEIEVGGLTAGTQHDQVQVTGIATLAGRLEVPIVTVPGQPLYTPAIGDSLTLLTAGGGVAGNFTALSSSNLSPDIALRVVKNATDMQLHFVEPGDIQFIDNTNTSWSNSSSWLGEDPNNPGNIINRAPIPEDVVTLSNLDPLSNPQRVDVVGPTDESNGLAHEITIADGFASITVGVQHGRSLSGAVGGVTIGQNGSIELGIGTGAGGGNLVGPAVTVQDGGLLAGNGTVRANNLIISDGTLRPGFSCGELVVDGNYQQDADGTLLVDLEGPTQFDEVVVMGSVDLGGTLEINASQLTTDTTGTIYEIIKGNSFNGDLFDSVEASGNDDIYFRQIFTEGGFGVVQMARGDMNGSGGDPDETDFDLFVYALMNSSLTKWQDECGEPCTGGLEALTPQQGGDFNGSGRVDFEDIPRFQEVCGPTCSEGLAAAFENYFAQVPEPSSAVLVVVAGLMSALGRMRSRGRQKWTL
jgi:autotransporter-associated beta strand protein